MRALWFGRGGVTPLHKQHEGKRLSQDKPIVALTPGPVVNIPLMQNIGAPSLPCVEVGQRVLVGEVIGRPQGFVGAPVHASVSGTVKAVSELLHVTGAYLPHIVIDNDGLYERGSALVPHAFEQAMAMPQDELRAIVKEGGVVGAGGATFPTHVKLSVPEGKAIDKLLINGAECEPFITADYRIMLEQSQQVAQGAALIARILGLSSVIIGIEDNKPQAIVAMEQAAKAHTGMSVAVLRTRYPQGSEKQLIYAITKRQVPSGKLPMEVGCVVCNVGTCLAVKEAVVDGLPMIMRVTTVSGAVDNPQNLRVRVGTSFVEAIEACGGYKENPQKLISGGPMMGVAQSDDCVSIVKGTSGITVLDEALVGHHKERNCVHCGKCGYACPMGLVPMAIDLYARNQDWARAEEYLAMNCIECGCCTYICPSKRHLVQSIRLAKGEIGKIARERAARAQAQGGGNA